MKNLGKIFLLLLIAHVAFGAVNATVDNRHVTLGDSVTLRLEVNGEDVSRPVIHSVCGVNVLSTGSQTSINMVNGKYSKSYIFSYTFEPTKDCHINPISVNVNGGAEKTNGIDISVNSSSVPVQDRDFIVTLKSSKQDVLVGESFDVELLIKQRRDASLVDSQFTPPNLDGFWVKKETKPKRTQDNRYYYTKVIYKLAAQRDGDMQISPAKMKIATRQNSMNMWGPFTQSVKWKSYYSNPITLHVKPLPAGVTLVGDFKISVTADKKELNKNEPLNLVVRVQGEGNLEDIKSFKQTIDGVNIFDEKIKINDTTKTLTQKFAYVGDNDFVIPPFKLRFFNPKTKKIEEIQTHAIAVKVKGGVTNAQEPLVIKKGKAVIQPVAQKGVAPLSKLWFAVAFVLGLLMGILLMFAKPWRLKRGEKSINIKDEKQLLIKLFPFKDDKEVQEIVDALEKNIYSNTNIKIEKKALKVILKKYNLL